MSEPDSLMHLTLVDWLVIAAYFAVNLLIGLWYRKRATVSTEDYFVSGRNVSWWLAGTSMVATLASAEEVVTVRPPRIEERPQFNENPQWPSHKHSREEP